LEILCIHPLLPQMGGNITDEAKIFTVSPRDKIGD